MDNTIEELKAKLQEQIKQNQELKKINKKFKKDLESLKFKVNLMDHILDNMYESVHALDTEGKVIIYSKPNEKYIPWKKEEALGKNEWELWSMPPDYEFNKMQIIKNGIPIKDIELTGKTTSGKEFKILAGFYPYIENGEYKAFYYTGRDITNKDSFIMRTYKLQNKMSNEYQDQNSNNCKFTFNNIIGESLSINKCIHISKKISDYESNVLIYGETGTGKELFAQGIHNSSFNSNEPFIALNCAAVPETLIESIFFGTVKGAFTGAHNTVGLFEQVGNGTLFLDEINSMHYSMQAKLLRVLQEKKVRKIGDTKEININCRIISATNIDPKYAIKKNLLRQDLFYRLSTVILYIPPLRERKEDIIPIIDHYLTILNKKYGKYIKEINNDMLDVFFNYNWPGNVRELINVLERAVMLSDYNQLSITPEMFPNTIYPKNRIKEPNTNNNENILLRKDLRSIISNYEKQIIINAIEQNTNNISLTARKLGIDRKTLYRKIDKYQILI